MDDRSRDRVDFECFLELRLFEVQTHAGTWVTGGNSVETAKRGGGLS
jgi:hypothetical protein